MEYMNVYTGEVRTGHGHTSEEIPVEPTVEPEDHRSITEQSYIPPQVQINDMLLAGLRLDAERRARFDSSDMNIEDPNQIPLDPTREPGVDLVDIQRIGSAARSTLEKIQIEENKKAKEKRDLEYKAELEKAVQFELELRKGRSTNDTASPSRIDPGASSSV